MEKKCIDCEYRRIVKGEIREITYKGEILGYANLEYCLAKEKLIRLGEGYRCDFYEKKRDFKC